MLFAKLRKTPLTIVYDVMMPCLLIVVVMISLHPIQLLANEVYEALKEKFVFEERGEIEVKGKGMMRTWFLVSVKE
jgi:hypothetical protein